MMRHLRANLMLLVLTVLICSVLYPAVLWAVGQTVFRANAQGSLVDGSGKPAASEQDAVGSLSIAQPFTGDEYFHPRPSAVSYNAAATGGSNWAANNPLLRDRVARILGPIVKYRGGPNKGKLVGPDIESWVQRNPGIVARWAQAHPDLAATLGKAEGMDIQSIFFELWLQHNPTVELEPVPADMVMASGSGLDPHITLKNALYQLDRVSSAWADRTKRKPDEVRKEIEGLLHQKAAAPLGGLAGVELVNVLEVNLALRERYENKATAAWAASAHP